MEQWKTGYTGAWKQWEDVIRNKPLKTGTQRMTMALTLLKGQAKELFQEALKFHQEDRPTGIIRAGDTTVFTKALNDTGRHFFPPKEHINVNATTCCGT